MASTAPVFPAASALVSHVAAPVPPATSAPASSPATPAPASSAAEPADLIGVALARDLADEAWYSLASTRAEAARKSYGAEVPFAAFAQSGDACAIGGGTYRIVGASPPTARDEAATLAALREAAPYLDALLARGYAVAGGAVLSAVIGGDIADVDVWRVGADPAEVEAALVDSHPRGAKGLKFRRFEGARHTTWALDGLPPLQLIRADFGAAECFRYFDIAIAKMAVVAVGGTPRVVLSADAARALATGVCPLDLARASPAFGRRLAKYSRRFRFAVRRRDGMSDKRYRITAAQTLVATRLYEYPSVFVVEHDGRPAPDAADALDKVSGYGAAVVYSTNPARDGDTEEINLRSLKRGDPQFLTRYDGWDSFEVTARHIARKAGASNFAMARALLDDEAYRAVVAAACSATGDTPGDTPRDARAKLARAVSDVLRAFAARRLAEMPPAPPIAELFARAPIDADAFYIPLG